MTEQLQLVDQLTTDAGRFTDVVAEGGNWEGASPCDGWTAGDVVDHVISTERDFLTLHGADLGEEPEGSAAQRWTVHWSQVEPVLQPELLSREFDGLLGTSTVGAALSTYYGMDLLIHRWDLGIGLGQEIVFTDDELARIEAKLDQVGDNIYKYGASKPPLPVPADASRQVAVLARIGRKA